MKLRNKTGYFNVLPEGTPPRKRSLRIVSFVYILLLICIAAYIAKVIAEKVLYVTARGQVIVTSQLIRCTQDGIIHKYLVADGDEVSKDTALVSIYQNDVSRYVMGEKFKLQEKLGLKQRQIQSLQVKIHAWERQKKNKSIRNTTRQNSISLGREILQVNYKIASKQYELQALRNKLGLADRTRLDDQIPVDLVLELRTRTGKEIKTIQKDVSGLRDQLISMKGNLGALYNLRDNLFDDTLNSLKEQNDRLQNELDYFQKVLSDLGEQEVTGRLNTLVKASTAGAISMSFKKDGDYCAKGEPILSFQPENPMVKIYGFFPIKTLASIQAGKKVVIIFPDKKKSEGKIEKVYSTSLPEPELIEKKYMPIMVDIQTEILPLQQSHKDLWKNYNQMDVVLRVKK